MAQSRFSGPIVSDNGFEGAVQVPTYTVASAPAATDLAGTMIYVSNGAAGAAVIAFSDGTNWKRCDTLATIAAA